MKVTVVGSGYVGLTTGAALAYIGHHVTLIDIDRKKIEGLRNGKLPIHEPFLSEVIEDAGENLTFYDDWDQFDPDSEVIIIAVGTPSKGNGDADLSYVESAAKEIGARLNDRTSPVIVNKSTVPIGSAERVKSVVKQIIASRGMTNPVHVASNPEFLREGEAVYDTFFPDRIILGVETDTARNRLIDLYQPILEQTFIPPKSLKRFEEVKLPVLITTSPTSAELIKYAANSFLAMKISFINEFAGLAEHVGADITEVAKGIGLDKRIGTHFLSAGVGWGGSCFGKDTNAILYTAQQYGYELKLVKAAREVNYHQRKLVVQKLQNQLKVLRGKTVGILGLAFKPNTDDVRDAPAIDIISHLLELDCHVKVYDPVAMENCKNSFPHLDITYSPTVEHLFSNVDAVVLLTDWDDFKKLPFQSLGDLMNQRIIVDGRNCLDPKLLQSYGYTYLGIGRGAHIE